MSSFEQFACVVSSSEAGGDFGRENVAMKRLPRVNASPTMAGANASALAMHVMLASCRQDVLLLA